MIQKQTNEETILVIEDNIDMRENITEILELANYKVFTAKNGKEGLEFLKKIVPDLILCDVMMPELNGYDVLREVGNIKSISNTPFIFLTALADKENVRQGMIGGADDYITKPYNVDELLEVINVRIKKAKSAQMLLKNDQKNMDVVLNVNYAEKIYRAFLTKEEEMKSVFPESLLIYKAQEIISGDFYHIYKNDNKSTIVLGDSTGHGVSASYISISMLNSLNKLMREGLDDPAEILETTHREMNYNTCSDKNNAIIESADTIICVIDHNTRALHYASAQMKGIIVRKGEIIELKNDRCSIGDNARESIRLTNHVFQLEKEDCLYLFSDGIENQFGAKENKRFNQSRLFDVLKENHSLSMEEQERNIKRVLAEWQGKRDRTDDMTLIGLRID